MMLLTVYFSPSFFTSYILEQYLTQQPVFKHTQPVFFSQCERKVSHPHKTTEQIILLYILILLFWDNKREDKMFWTE